MKIAKTLLAMLAVPLLMIAFAPGTRADTSFSKRTVVTFKQPVEIPGQVLPAGTYTIELMESYGNRHIVRFMNADRTKQIAIVLAIPNYRLTATDKTVMTFAERPGAHPDALKAWFYPGDGFGQEFVYPKARATELAQVTHEPVPAVEEEPTTVEQAKNEPIVAETPEQTEVQIAEVFPTQAPGTATLTPAPALPKTASPVPLIGLLGILSISFAFVLRRLVS